jgi:hypothetical protein
MKTQLCFVQLTIAFAIWIAGYQSAKAVDEYDLGGPAVRVQVDSVSLCVDPRFVEPNDLRLYRRNGKPVSAFPTRGSVPLALFSERLIGYTDAQYAAGIAKVYDKRLYPPDWVRAEILPQSAGEYHVAVPDDYLKSFETEWTLEHGFRSHRRRQDCVGRSLSWGAFSAITYGEECRQTELKYGHSANPSVVLYCNTTRCYIEQPLRNDAVRFKYDFPCELGQASSRNHEPCFRMAAESAMRSSFWNCT